jgi:integrase
VRLGPQHERDGELRFRTEKTNAEVTLEILPELQEAIDAGPTADLAFICGSHGERMTKESFGNAFRDACRAAGVNKSAHGLRKLAATTAAENGANESVMNALFSWTGSAMAALLHQRR